MSGYDQRMYVGFIAILFSLICSLINFKSLNKSARVLSILIAITFFFELAAEVSARVLHTNMLVYSVFNVVQFFLISVFFNYSIDTFKEKNIGLIIGVFGVVWGGINYLLIESPYRLNSIYLLSEDVVIVAMALYSFYRMLLIDDDVILVKQPNFWFTSLLMFFWTGTFLIWGTFEYLTTLSQFAKSVLLSVLLAVNVISYVGFGIVFICYNKMHEEYGR